jgi:hypothetical protein
MAAAKILKGVIVELAERVIIVVDLIVAVAVFITVLIMVMSHGMFVS